MARHTRRRGGLWAAALLPALLLALMVASATACQSSPTEPLRIGALLVDSTDPSLTSQDRLRSLRLAVTHVNNGGGVFGVPVELIEGDLQSPEQEAWRLIHQEGVHAIVGPSTSADSLRVIAVAAPARVPVVSPSASSPMLTVSEDDDFFFRTVLSDVAQGPALAELAESRMFDSAGVIYRDDAWGRGLADAFLAAWQGEVVAVASPAADAQRSYLPLLQESAREDPDVLVVLTFRHEGEVLLREALDSGLYDEFLLGDALRRPELPLAVGSGRLAGVHGTTSGAHHVTEASRAWDAAYVEAYGAVTEANYAEESYDAGIAIALAAEAAGVAEGVAIRDALRGVTGAPGERALPGAASIARALRALRDGDAVNYDGASGPVDWDAAGDLRSGYISIWRINEDDEIEDEGSLPYQQ